MYLKGSYREFNQHLNFSGFCFVLLRVRIPVQEMHNMSFNMCVGEKN